MPLTKFQIMRINRGFGDYVNHKAKLVEEIDACEMHVLRTLQRRQKEEAYLAAERIAAVMEEEKLTPMAVGLTPSAPPTAQPPVLPKIPEWTRPGLVERLLFLLTGRCV